MSECPNLGSQANEEVVGLDVAVDEVLGVQVAAVLGGWAGRELSGVVQAAVWVWFGEERG